MLSYQELVDIRLPPPKEEGLSKQLDGLRAEFEERMVAIEKKVRGFKQRYDRG